jgi:hypothetical protein
MRNKIGLICLLSVIFCGIPAAYAAAPASEADPNTIIIVFKDGRQQTFSMADIERIEFKSPAPTSIFRGGGFVGKWKVGEGNGSSFYITLDRNGVATKSIGASHGTWTLVDNEARISWDDGWHDALRKTGAKCEKRAFEPGKSFTDTPNNVTQAKKTDAQPI